MLEATLIVGVAKFTWFARPLCQHALGGNTEFRGRGGLLARGDDMFMDTRLCCELFSVNSPQINVLSVMQKPTKLQHLSSIDKGKVLHGDAGTIRIRIQKHD